MRHYKIEEGEYYRVSLHDGTKSVGKVIEVVPRRDENANFRFRVEVTEGEKRGKLFVLSSRRIKGLADTEQQAPSEGAAEDEKDRVPHKDLTFNIIVSLQVPMGDLASLMEVLQDYSPSIRSINPSE